MRAGRSRVPRVSPLLRAWRCRPLSRSPRSAGSRKRLRGVGRGPPKRASTVLTSPHERICLDARRHGIVLVRPLAQACGLALAGGYGLLRGWPWSVGGALLACVGALLALRAGWRWERTRVVVTTEKLCFVHGTLRRRGAAVGPPPG